MIFLACSLSVPTTTRSGVIKSLIAVPSFKNSGLEATSNTISTPRFSNSARTVSFTFWAVPTGTVDLVTNMVYLWIFCPNVLATAKTYFKSALPSSSGGVPTALNTTSTLSKQLDKSVVKCNRPASTLRFTNSSKPGS